MVVAEVAAIAKTLQSIHDGVVAVTTLSRHQRWLLAKAERRETQTEIRLHLALTHELSKIEMTASAQEEVFERVRDHLVDMSDDYSIAKERIGDDPEIQRALADLKRSEIGTVATRRDDALHAFGRSTQAARW